MRRVIHETSYEKMMKIKKDMIINPSKDGYVYFVDEIDNLALLPKILKCRWGDWQLFFNIEDTEFTDKSLGPIILNEKSNLVIKFEPI